VRFWEFLTKLMKRVFDRGHRKVYAKEDFLFLTTLMIS